MKESCADSTKIKTILEIKEGKNAEEGIIAKIEERRKTNVSSIFFLKKRLPIVDFIVLYSLLVSREELMKIE